MIFLRRNYQATENSGRMVVDIGLIRGTSNVPVNVLVRLRGQTATGIILSFDIRTYINHFILLAGLDFVSTTLNALIPAGQSNTTVTVPILQDNNVERNEMFILQLELRDAIPGVTLTGVRTAVGTIIDSTGTVTQEK